MLYLHTNCRFSYLQPTQLLVLLSPDLLVPRLLFAERVQKMRSGNETNLTSEYEGEKILGKSEGVSPDLSPSLHEGTKPLAMVSINQCSYVSFHREHRLHVKYLGVKIFLSVLIKCMGLLLFGQTCEGYCVDMCLGMKWPLARRKLVWAQD